MGARCQALTLAAPWDGSVMLGSAFGLMEAGFTALLGCPGALFLQVLKAMRKAASDATLLNDAIYGGFLI